MPWHIEADNPDCAGWAVVKDDDGSIAGCHDTEQMAQDQLAALYANEPEMAAQPLDPTPGMPDPQQTASEFDIPTLDNPDAPPSDSAALAAVAKMAAGTPCYGAACIEGIPDGAMPRRMWAPGSIVFSPTPFPVKFQPAENDGHDGAMISGRVDAIWRDGALIRFIGQMDSAGVVGREHERLIGGGFARGVSIMADDVTEADIEYVYPAAPDPTAIAEVDGEPVEADADGEDFHLPGKHNQKDHSGGAAKGQRDYDRARAAERSRRRRSSAIDAVTADGMEMEMMTPAQPEMIIYHHGRIRSITGVAEPAWVECTISLGESPFQPPMIAEVSPLAEVEAMAAEMEMAPPAAVPLVAAGFSINIPELWPEWWFEQPSDAELAQVASGAVQITPDGRVWGLLAPAGVDHRAFRASGRQVKAPRNIDYSEWQNKACIVAGADGGVYKINAGTVTFGCGHASPSDPRRADPSWAAEHYDNSCSVAMRARAGEHPRFGTWFAGGLAHGLTASAFEQIMGCALSGDWQGGKLKGALLVPVEGFPVAVTASVRERMGVLVASSVPIQFQAPEPDRTLDFVFDLVASARYDEIAMARFDEIAAELAAERG